MKDAVSREYRYLILNRRPRASLGNDMYYHVSAELDAGQMDLASKLLIGEHDFASFVTDWDREESTVRTIYDAGVEREGDEIAFQVSGQIVPDAPGAQYGGHPGKGGDGKNRN